MIFFQLNAAQFRVQYRKYTQADIIMGKHYAHSQHCIFDIIKIVRKHAITLGFVLAIELTV